MVGAAVSLVYLFAKEFTGRRFDRLDIRPVLRAFRLLVWISLVVLEQKLETGGWRQHALRATFVLASQYCYFYYLSVGSLLVGTLLWSTAGRFLPFVTYFAAHIEIKKRTLAAIAISFIGVAVVLKPTSGFDWLMLIGLFAGFLNACSQEVMHYSSKRISALSATIMMYALCGLGALVVLAGVGGFGKLASVMALGHPSAAHIYLVLVAFAVFSISNQAFRSKAFRLVNQPASLSPFYYAAIAVSGALDWWVYDIVPTWNVYLGTAMIVAGAVVMAWRGEVDSTEQAPPA